MATRVENGKSEPIAEFTRERKTDVPPPNRKQRSYLVLGGIVVCVLALAAYIMRSSPAKPDGATITASNITSTSATIAWTTDKPLASQVEYGTTTAYGSLSVYSPSPVTSHSVNLTGLTPGTTYNYAALSTEAAGKVRTSPNSTFTTSGTGSATGSSSMSNVTAGGITQNSATITWTTDQPLSAQVEYGTTPAYGTLSVFISSPALTHSVKVAGLTPGTTYNYAALSTNSTGQVSKSANFTFTTSGAAITSGAAGSPLISGVAVSGITQNSAIITWTTNQPVTAQVEYGTTPAYGSLSVFNPAPALSHSVKMTALMPGTTYNYAVLSTNPAGQVTVSSNFTLTTASAPGTPVISNVTTSAITTNSAAVSWSTDTPSASQVQFGTTTAYGSLSLFRSPLVTSHSITISGLAPGTAYDFSALSSNSTGQVGASANFTFTTASGPPAIRQVAANRTTGDSATITWITDQPSTSQVKYGARSVLQLLLRRRTYDLLSARDSSLVTSHSVILNGLTPDTTYNFVVVSVNSQGIDNSSFNLKF